ncbi:glycosyltransferase family 4 protein [Subsaxibacter sp. CAU 1640]|uniref:glycosyltransferase family 4 protein n=1 Tax=Subsaxibacter sp. CAU 1640 TaxID=2933271 RepID=UPI0020045F25|nr:glycosyltransferase family 1 protein [Subsaxibacter sp. CAU 1640]MCK7590222.1 glycosyltransferase family 4 protein [Subsaxibacter sp. CAU 1640]
MKSSVTYIYRKPNPNYFSIESLFHNVSKKVALHSNIKVLKLHASGGNFRALWSNLISFKREKETLYHITGDVHYMALVTGKNSVLTIHDIGSALKGNFVKLLYIRLFWFWLPALFVKRITVISEFTKNELVTIIPFAKSKIRVINNPVDPKFKFDSYQFNEKDPTILFIGTKSNKNLERSFEAIKDITCKALIVGKMTEKQIAILNKFEIEYENKNNLTFEEVVDCYRSCDLLCFASFYEGFGMPIIEAQATGRPVVTSDFGAMKEVSNKAACLVDPKNVNSIRNAILKVCQNRSYRQQLIEDGLENVKRFRSEAIANQYIELYKEVLT